MNFRLLPVALILFSIITSGCEKPGPPDTTTTGGVTDTTPSVPAAPAIPELKYEVVGSFPHDTAAFTQGLFFDSGALYESTGQEGRSFIRQVDLATGKKIRQVDLPAQYFGEGIAMKNGKLYQLTWRSSVGFIYDPISFRQIDTFTYTGEGWGMTHDSTSLIMSDGTSFLRFLDPESLNVTRTLPVYAGNTPVSDLNELENVNGQIYANVWKTDKIARIDPATGAVTGWIDLTGILPVSLRTGHEDVLNGIAYDPKKGTLFVTGKNWPRLFEIRLTPAA